jgi:hypothetical protein
LQLFWAIDEVLAFAVKTVKLQAILLYVNLTTIKNQANKPAQGCQSYGVSHVLSHHILILIFFLAQPYSPHPPQSSPRQIPQNHHPNHFPWLKTSHSKVIQYKRKYNHKNDSSGFSADTILSKLSPINNWNYEPK